MEITVCFRAVPDISLAREENWSADPNVCLEGSLGRQFDQYDECALELALRIRDALSVVDGRCILRAVTLENFKGDSRLYERLFALGYDSVERIELENDTSVPALRFSPLARARILARHISRKEKPDLILCGIQGGMAGSRLTGYGISRVLDIPCLNNVSNLSVFAGGALHAECYEDGTTVVGTLETPSLLLVGNTANSMIRVPTLKAKLAVRGKKAEAYSIPIPDDAQVDYDISVSQKTTRGLCRFLQGSRRDQAQVVLDAFEESGGDSK